MPFYAPKRRRATKQRDDAENSTSLRYNKSSSSTPKPTTQPRYHDLNLNLKFESKSPSICKNPHKWFDYYDKDKNQMLSRQEFIDALLELHDLKDQSNHQKFLRNIKLVWAKYDVDYCGQIDKHSFFKNGLAKEIVKIEKIKNGKIQLHIPIGKGMKPNHVIQIISPRNQLPMKVSIPQTTMWHTMNGKSFFFVLFV